MANYPTKYLFIAETQGIAQAARELNSLKSAMQGMQANPINLSRAQQAQANAAAAASRAAQAQANAQNAANRAQAAGIRTAQQQAAANTQAAISIQKVAQAQSNAAAAAARAQAAQARATRAVQGPDDPNYLERFAMRFRSAFAYTVAFAAIGGTFAAIGGSIRSWVDAQIQLNDVITDTAILLGKSADAGLQFANTQRALSFATGQGLEEVAPSSMMSYRIGQPGLAVSAAQWSMVLPELMPSDSVDDLRALSIQFENLSLDEINDSLLAVMQNSGIAANQLFDLSASFGVFAGQLGLGETSRDLREIGGLFAALSNITGQTTPTLQNFVRRMADEFYAPDAELRKRLEAAGIQTVTQGPVTTTYDVFGNPTRTAEEIRRPFTEIFAEIATTGPAAIKAFSTAIDNSLGQPTQSQFILVAENWDRVAETLWDVTHSTADFGEAAQDASEKLQIALDRIGVSFANFLSVVGDQGMLQASLDQVGSAFQNTYDASRDPDKGMRQLSRVYNRRVGGFFGGTTNELYDIQNSIGLEAELDRAYGSRRDNLLTRRLHEILRVIQVPEGLSDSEVGPYIENAVRQFMASDYVRPGDLSTTGAQQFQRFYQSEEFDRVEAFRATGAHVDSLILSRFSNILTEMEKQVLLPWSARDTSGIASFAPVSSTFSSAGFSSQAMSGFYPSSRFDLRNQMIPGGLAQALDLGSIFDFKQIGLPEGVTPDDFDKAYDEVTGILANEFGPAILDAEVEVLAFRDSTTGLITTLGAYNQFLAGETIRALQNNKGATDVLTTGFYNLSGAAAAAAGGLSAILGRSVIGLSEGMTPEDYLARYNQLEPQLTRFFGGQELSDKQPQEYLFRNEDTGKFYPTGANLNPDIKNELDYRLGLEQAQRDKELAEQKAADAKQLAEQKSYQSKALAAQEAYQNKMLGAWSGMINDILKPSEVTGTDLFFGGPGGTYNDNWDEPVRRMRADINNAIGGRALEYGYGGLGQYMNMDAINAAMGMDQAAKESILRSEEARVADQFYNMELPWEAYAGNTDAIIANAQAWIAGRQQKNANMANVQQLLIDAGLGPDAEAFVKAMEEPPILRQLFGGKSSSEIATTVTEAVTPDLGKAIGEQVVNVTWAATISTAISNDVSNNYELIVAAGRAIGKPLAEGSAQAIATAIIPLVIAAIVGSNTTP